MFFVHFYRKTSDFIYIQTKKSFFRAEKESNMKTFVTTSLLRKQKRRAEAPVIKQVYLSNMKTAESDSVLLPGGFSIERISCFSTVA